uniref:AMP-binding protein n=1 Tax=Pseudomonas laurentiana TaxID=2364649 RepID=UPI0029C89E09|nr:AMP-binding protein [Pseudomonas laurentiana]
MSPELSLFENQLQRYAQERPFAPALWGDELRLDYESLWAEVSYRRKILSAQPEGVVVLALDNGPEAMLWDLAVLFEKRPCLTLPPFFSPAQRLHCLEQCQAPLVVAEPGMASELESAGYRDHGKLWYKAVTSAVALPEGTAKITFTSGTTGAPKGVCLSAESFLRVARELAAASEAVKPEHHLALLPLAILLENLGCYAALFAGAVLSLPSQASLGIRGASGVDAPTFLACLASRRPHSLILVPQLLQLLVGAARAHAFDPSCLRFAAVGGARVSPSLLHTAHQLGIPAYEGYGLSECASVVCLNVPGAIKPGSVGRPLPHLKVKLADDGEVLIQGSTMLGYMGSPAQTTEWLASGDIGEFDADGFLYIKGRKKHQFVTSYGRNVNPEWVEAELTQGGVIAQAFVHGEALPYNAALLWPHDPTCSDQVLADAVAQANAALPDYARVHHWLRLPQPFTPANGLLTANGRPRRDAILEQYQAALESFNRSEELSS